MCCEQLWFLLHEGFVFDVDRLLCQPYIVTARWIPALVGVATVSWIVDHGHQRNHVSTAQMLSAWAVRVTELSILT